MGRRKCGNLVRQKGDGEAVQWHIDSGEAGGGGRSAITDDTYIG